MRDSLDDPQRAIMLAYADPVCSSATVAGIMREVVTTDLDSVTVFTLGHAASCIGDFELADLFLADAAARLRAEGRLQVLARAVVMQAWARLRRGQWSTAMPLAEEGSRLAEESGQAEWLAAGLVGQAMVAALRGDVAEAMRAADRSERIAIPGRMTNVAAVTLLARATAAAAEGDFAVAWDYLSRAAPRRRPELEPVPGAVVAVASGLRRAPVRPGGADPRARPAADRPSAAGAARGDAADERDLRRCAARPR